MNESINRNISSSDSITKKQTSGRNQSKTMKRRKDKMSVSRPPINDNDTYSPYYKDMGGIIKKMLSLRKKIEDTTGNESHITAINNTIPFLTRGNLSTFHIHSILDDVHNNINSEEYWEYLQILSDEQITTHINERQEQIKEIMAIMYKSSTPLLIRQLAILNDSAERERKLIDKLIVSDNPKMHSKINECLLNIIESNKYLDELLILNMKVQEIMSIEKFKNNNRLERQMKSVYKITDVCKEEVLQATDMLGKMDKGSIENMLMITHKCLDMLRESVVKAQHIINKIDN